MFLHIAILLLISSVMFLYMDVAAQVALL